jgi:hypothetical protein
VNIRKLFCYVVICDACHHAFANDGDLHFNSHDAALRYVTEHAGWNITEHGYLLCPHCDAYFHCVEHGHDWSPWAPCPCAGWIPEHSRAGCPLRRMCQRCDEVETVTLADLPTSDEPTTSGR